MTRFQNKVTGIEVPDNSKTPEVGKPLPMRNLTYAELAIICLDHQPEGGFSISEMRSRMRIEEKLDAIKNDPGKMVELEDAELDKIKECESTLDGKWIWKHIDIVNFSDYIRGLESEPTPETPTKET